MDTTRKRTSPTKRLTMKYFYFLGGIAQFMVAGLISMAGYEPSVFSQTVAYVFCGIGLINLALEA